MKKEELRKVEFSVYSQTEFKFNLYTGYFHCWADSIKEIQTRISDDLYGLKKVLVKMAIVEEESTGEVYMVEPNNIVFTK